MRDAILHDEHKLGPDLALVLAQVLAQCEPMPCCIILTVSALAVAAQRTLGTCLSTDPQDAVKLGQEHSLLGVQLAADGVAYSRRQRHHHFQRL